MQTASGEDRDESGEWSTTSIRHRRRRRRRRRQISFIDTKTSKYKYRYLVFLAANFEDLEKHEYITIRSSSSSSSRASVESSCQRINM